MPKIDEACYAAGRAAFKNGTSVRSVIDQPPDATEEQGISTMLGFLDAALDKLRGIER